MRFHFSRYRKYTNANVIDELHFMFDYISVLYMVLLCGLDWIAGKHCYVQ